MTRNLQHNGTQNMHLYQSLLQHVKNILRQVAQEIIQQRLQITGFLISNRIFNSLFSPGSI